MRVIGGILVLFNVYKLHSSYIRHEIIRQDGLLIANIAKLVEKRREAGDNSQKGTGDNRGGAGRRETSTPLSPPLYITPFN